jgi:hypothetical protein
MSQIIKQLAFMTEAADGTYEAPKPSDEQLAAILPWLVDQVITWAQHHGHCETVDDGLHHLAADGNEWDGELRFYDAAGYNCYGYNRAGYNVEGYNKAGYNVEGYNKWGYNRDGYNKDGYNEMGRDKDGFNKDGINRNGKTREQLAADTVAGWNPEYLRLVAAKLTERQAAEAAAKIVVAAVDAIDTPTEELADAVAA